VVIRGDRVIDRVLSALRGNLQLTRRLVPYLSQSHPLDVRLVFYNASGDDQAQEGGEADRDEETFLHDHECLNLT